MKLIVGLGNLGREYENTRHNIGWMAIEAFAAQHAGSWREETRFQSFISEVRVGTEKILLARPTTFMNRSGEAAQAIIAFYHLELNDVLILQDEMDFAFGRFAFLKVGTAAGHNGIRSIQERLATSELGRLRIGIDRPQPPLSKEAYVLQAFSENERVQLPKLLSDLVDAQTTWITEGLDKAMNLWNGKER